MARLFVPRDYRGGDFTVRYHSFPNDKAQSSMSIFLLKDQQFLIGGQNPFKRSSPLNFGLLNSKDISIEFFTICTKLFLLDDVTKSTNIKRCNSQPKTCEKNLLKSFSCVDDLELGRV